MIKKVFKEKKYENEQYSDSKFKIKIFRIAQPIIINNEFWGVVLLGFSLESLSKEINNMQRNFLTKIEEEKKRLEGEAGNQKTYEIDKITKNLAIISKKIRKNIQDNAILYFIMFSIPGLFLAFIFGKNIARPIISFVPFIQKISQGILTDRIKMKRNDEIKILADGINAMVNELNNIIKTINNIIKSITFENSNLLDISKQTTITIDTISNNINEIEVGVINNSMDVQSTAERLKRFVTTLEEMTDNVQNLDRSAEQTEMSTIKGKENFAKLIEKMNSIESGYKETFELVNNLQKFSLEIKDILQTIEDISTRTRVLAYSVNVISKRTGQQDASIANIASEVRNLSKFIADYSANIMKIIDNNNILINKIFQSTKIGIKNIEEGILTSNNLMNTMNEIYVKVTSDKVMISEINEKIANIDEESKTIFSSTENISQVTSQMSTLVSSTAKVIYEERESVKKLNESVNKLSSIAESLKEKMKEFVIDE
ncbi:MAG TPA: methyl-accepting chemotaxis protein, partial [bacterium]|nr:methyl-accepting chemotaxis protein [bacterium]